MYHGGLFRRKYNFHGQRFILRDTNGFEVCKLIPPQDICCTPVSFPSCGSIKRTVAFPEGEIECGMPREEMHQRTKYFAHGSRNVRSALNHLQFKDANGGNGVFEKKIKRIGAAALWQYPKAGFSLQHKMHFILA